MAAITVTITESDFKLIAGIPKTITLESNIPATIFYTLDGSEPTTNSLVAVGPITMPTDEGTVILKYFATNGSITCPIISQSFGPNVVPQRNPRDKILLLHSKTKKPPFPFSSPSFTGQGVSGIFLNAGGIDVNNPLKSQIPDGYDGTGTNTHSNFTNEELSEYNFIFSETNFIGETGKGIGTLPAGVTVIQKKPEDPSTFSDANSAFFDSKALVIFQDTRQEQFDDVPRINRPHFDLENSNVVRDGALKYTMEAQGPSGGALRQHYNPKDNTINYYYFDSRTSRWIISKVPFQPKTPNLGNYSRIVFPSRGGSGGKFVYRWIPFHYRRLT